MTYKPIDCGLYDELELLALRKEVVKIKYSDGDSQTISCESVIQDLFSDNKIEFLKLTDGTKIRLDNLIEVNGKKFGASCNL